MPRIKDDKIQLSKVFELNRENFYLVVSFPVNGYGVQEIVIQHLEVQIDKEILYVKKKSFS